MVIQHQQRLGMDLKVVLVVLVIFPPSSGEMVVLVRVEEELVGRNSLLPLMARQLEELVEMEDLVVAVVAEEAGPRLAAPRTSPSRADPAAQVVPEVPVSSS
jgi:hypothetical protein